MTTRKIPKGLKKRIKKIKQLIEETHRLEARSESIGYPIILGTLRANLQDEYADLVDQIGRRM